MEQVSSERIDQFFEGHDPQKYIIAIESNYFDDFVTLVINDPNRPEGETKYLVRDKYKPFFWMNDAALNEFYGGNRSKLRTELRKSGIQVKLLTTKTADGFEPERMKRGFKYLVKGNKGYMHLLEFFKQAGSEPNKSKNCITISPTEQYMMQSGKRLFKGMEDYNDIHRLQFDLETTGLDPKTCRINQIGIRDNRGLEHIISIEEGPNRLEREVDAIRQFFFFLDALKPDVIEGYYSEGFDWPFLYDRCDLLGEDIRNIAKTLNDKKQIKRGQNTLKLGQDTERYEQTYIWGTNISDIIHSVRRAQAINSDIKASGLKYITKFSEIAKPNRVYVPGNLISTTWGDTVNDFALNDTNGDWYKITETRPLLEDYKVVTGKYIVDRYLLDDLWETEQVGYIYNQASFLMSKILPTSFMRVLTMGTATIWKLIMMAWSYENDLAIPEFDKKRDFAGGLARLLRVGRADKYSKFDYAALYPKTQITHGIIPDIDISGVMMSLLIYIVETRDKYKALKNHFESIGDFKTAGMYDRKQLPIKILANSFFGSYGAPDVFPWSHMDSAEETTCRGRMYLRLMVKFFYEKYGFEPLVGDTDGFNFESPKNVNDFKYTSDGTHSFNEKDKEYFGVNAVVAEFNDKYMIGRMGLDIDEIGESTINFARKNYANKVIKKGKVKIKLVGNTIKSKSLPTYIEEFLDKAIVLLLDDKGSEFITLYLEYVEKIYNYQIPLVKIASKSKVKARIDDYIAHTKQKNKAGKPMPKQAHMELAIKENLKVDLGDVIYYVNIGTKKSHGDIKTKKGEVEFNCKMIPAEQIENDPNLTTDEYNVPKYLEAFNNRIRPLLVVFDKSIRDKILMTIKVDRKTKQMILSEPFLFKDSECKLVAGQPDEAADQDDYQRDLMDFEDKELKFWVKVNKIPNNLEDIGISMERWGEIVSDYLDRVAKMKAKEVENEKNKVDDLIRRLDIEALDQINELLDSDFDAAQNLLTEYFKIAYISVVDDGEIVFMSNMYDEIIGKLDDLEKYREDAINRSDFYENLTDEEMDKPYEAWLKYVETQKALLIMTGDTENEITEDQIEACGGYITPIEVQTLPEPPKIEPIADEDIEWGF